MENSIDFQLFAPRVSEAQLIGSWNHWQPLSMQKGDNGYFRAAIELADGIYHYKFRLISQSEPAGQWLEVNDPYATEIDRETQNSVVRIKAGQRTVGAHTWQHDQHPLPANDRLVIYEMHISDFCGDADIDQPNQFERAIGKLDYLQELGINAIGLLPVSEYAGDYRWGYLVRDFLALESSYGTPQAFKQFVDQCHGRGIRVFMDGIYNHSDEQSPLVLIDRDYWYYPDRHYPDDPNNYWGPEFNYEHTDEALAVKPAWKFVGDVVRFWIEEYHLDGIRYDAVRQLNNAEFLHWITQEAIRAAGNKPFYNIAEHIPEKIEMTTAGGGAMDGCWHESFRIFAIDHICGEFNLDQLKEALDPRRQGYKTATNVINYLASHDRQHPIVELGDRGIIGTAAFERVKLGVVLQMTAVGIPMIWMGDEFGQDTHKTQQTTEPNPLKWKLLEQDLNRELLEFYKRLIQLRQQTPALQSDNIEFFAESPDDRVLAYVRWSDRGSQVAVVANFSDCDLESYKICNFPNASTWQEWSTGNHMKLNNSCLAIDLPAHTAKIFWG